MTPNLDRVLRTFGEAAVRAAALYVKHEIPQVRADSPVFARVRDELLLTIMEAWKVAVREADILAKGGAPGWASVAFDTNAADAGIKAAKAALAKA
jgi:hypothetical protein